MRTPEEVWRDCRRTAKSERRRCAHQKKFGEIAGRQERVKEGDAHTRRSLARLQAGSKEGKKEVRTPEEVWRDCKQAAKSERRRCTHQKKFGEIAGGQHRVKEGGAHAKSEK